MAVVAVAAAVVGREMTMVTMVILTAMEVSVAMAVAALLLVVSVVLLVIVRYHGALWGWAPTHEPRPTWAALIS